jgi:lipopolysaccharide transport system ATP-binding protein
MTDAVSIRSLSKTYTINQNGINPFVRYGEQFAALKNISFDIPIGQRIGIIGKNGAGKSTLLKILSRITAPSSGEIIINGRVGSLLEVGTGFHPELTGRENVFLNGSILGMSRATIKNKFSDIVDFSGVGQFIDTPVKRYSSGMQTRLAFSVAAFLEPEVLIVDEVLSVGDAGFQKRSLGKMNEFSQSGRTILFVSHNMDAVRRLCDRCIYLKNGQIQFDSNNVDDVVTKYLSDGNSDINNESLFWINNDKQPVFHKMITPKSFCLVDAKGLVIDRTIFPEEDIFVEVSFDLHQEDLDLSIGYHLYSEDHKEILYSYTVDHTDFDAAALKTGPNRLRSKFPSQILNKKEYYLKLTIGIHGKFPIFSAEESPVSFMCRVDGAKSRSVKWHNKCNDIAPSIAWF